MYTTFYKLKHKPFQISTDPKFLWLGEKHEEALATLQYGILDNKGFLLLTGDVGTGKTTLINTLLKTLAENTLVATIRDPALDLIDFYNFTAHAFGLEANFTNKASFLIQFERFLLDAYESGKKVLLIIDEAQRISQEMLEEVRLLSNIEKEDTKLLNIFFVGQLEFNDLLLQQDNMPIRQRITVNYNLKPLTFPETALYIQHRLKIAGSRKTIFDGSALGKIFTYTKGYPRLINILCDRCLLTGFAEDTKTISIKQVNECIEELEIPKSKFHQKLALNTAEMKEQGAMPQAENPESQFKIPTKNIGKTAFQIILYLINIVVILLIGYFIFSERKSVQDFPGNLKSAPALDAPGRVKDSNITKQETTSKTPQPPGTTIRKEPILVVQPKVPEKNETH